MLVNSGAAKAAWKIGLWFLIAGFLLELDVKFAELPQLVKGKNSVAAFVSYQIGVKCEKLLMGNVGNGIQEVGTNTVENMAEEPQCNPLTLDNDKMDCGVAERDFIGAQNIEKKLVSIGGSSEIIKEKGFCHGETSKDLGAGNGGSELVNVKIMQAFENLGVPSVNKLTNLGNISTDSVIAGGGQLETPQRNPTNDSAHSNNEARRSSEQSHKRRAKLKGPVTSSWSLRPKSQEKRKEPEPINTLNEATISGEKKRRRRKKQQQQKKNTANEFSKTKSHLKYLLHRISYEQSLIDAYSAEGWKGQSLEKLKPEKELQRAKSQILRYKMKIRELFQRLDQSLTAGKLPESLFDSEGEIDCEDIFCAKCGSKDLTLDNDIILCDGVCERGFHQFCVEPPLLKEDIPPGDEGWLCPGCDCKVDCIDMLKDFQGSKIKFTDSWEKVFPEAAADASGMKLDDGSGSISDDSEDDDYDPDKHNKAEEADGDELSPDESNYFSAPDDSAPSLNNEKYLGLPSDDSEDDDFDPSAPNQDEDEQVKQNSSSSDFTSDSEDLGALLEDEGGHGEDRGQVSSPPVIGQTTTGCKEENSGVGRKKRQTLKDELLYLTETSVEPISSKRRVERLDYKKLNDETFGNSSSDSSDEDFDDDTSDDDTTSPKRRRTTCATTRVKRETPDVETSINSNGESQKERKQLPTRSRRKGADGGPRKSSTKVGPTSSGSKRSAPKRLGEATTQRLYASFNENQYPDKDVRENLAQELGITVLQVSKWFANARWSFNHKPRTEPNSTKKPPEPSQAIEENSASKTNEEISGKQETENGNGYAGKVFTSPAHTVASNPVTYWELHEDITKTVR
ncbi:homeobox family protein [Striga asiatica]|uniref:Homeobox family protein n=1 Tax=Striga asiatica TaxID=4170 RepID=A0A5A7QA82_STRAF|nr:homeobox family protein [Striga asiatica]